jgi:hypothetical protein
LFTVDRCNITKLAVRTALVFCGHRPPKTHQICLSTLLDQLEYRESR